LRRSRSLRGGLVVACGPDQPLGRASLAEKARLLGVARTLAAVRLDERSLDSSRSSAALITALQPLRERSCHALIVALFDSTSDLVELPRLDLFAVLDPLRESLEFRQRSDESFLLRPAFEPAAINLVGEEEADGLRRCVSMTRPDELVQATHQHVLWT
jgi:hypothetical protein